MRQVLASAKDFGCAKFLPSPKDFEGANVFVSAKVFGCVNVFVYNSGTYILCIFLHSYLVSANNVIGANILRLLG